MKHALLAVLLIPVASCGPQGKPYPLDTCVVSGKKLGEHGDPYVFVRDGQQVKLCCESCLEDFDKEAAKHLERIKAAGK